MENKINVSKLLKDCPKGMELDCTMFEGVYFDHVDDLRLNRIKCYVDNGNEHFEIALDEHGQYISNNSAKCVIYPKGKDTWEGFQRPYIKGDIVCTNCDSIAILGDKIGEHSVDFNSYCGLINYEFDCNIIVSPERLATEEEKQKLFDAIKVNGYKWNAETKTLEKLIQPKFKVGDRIKNKTSIWSTNRTIKSYDKNIGYFTTINDWVRIEDQDDWELVPDKFDVSTLVPFESKVLVRNDKDQYWIPAFWGYKRADGFYTTTFGWCKYCIPFEGNEHLLDSNKECDEFYRTWEKTGE